MDYYDVCLYNGDLVLRDVEAYDEHDACKQAASVTGFLIWELYAVSSDALYPAGGVAPCDGQVGQFVDKRGLHD